MVRTAQILSLVAGATGPARALGLVLTDSGAPYRQVLKNYHDLQYFADMQIGGQDITGIIDTGSFEIVAFPKRCSSCGRAIAYDSGVSHSYRKGNRSQVHSYGSGSCTSEDGQEHVSFGQLVAKDQWFWEAVSCEMPLLNQASFNAIIGVGPPGQPEYSARQQLKKIKKVEDEKEAQGLPLPEEYVKAKAQSEQELEDALKKTAMLDSFDVKTFSFCFGRQTGSSGVIVWYDPVPQSAKTVDVVGDIMWGAKLSDFRIVDSTGSERMHACKDGCAVVVDTGTSLIGVPSDVYYEAFSAMENQLLDCTDLSKMPDLVLNLGGEQVRFPPEEYVGHVYGNVSYDMKRFFNGWASVSQPLHEGTRGRCELLLMDIGNQKTKFGPMFILGMPFFREYYTTFDLGSGRGDRHISFVQADNDCNPADHRSLHRRDVRDEPSRTGLRRAKMVDASRIRVPHWLLRDDGLIVF